MNKKLEIIARLLKEDKLTVEEATILMEKDYQYPFYYQGYSSPEVPWISPYTITCSTASTTI